MNAVIFKSELYRAKPLFLFFTFFPFLPFLLLLDFATRIYNGSNTKS